METKEFSETKSYTTPDGKTIVTTTIRTSDPSDVEFSATGRSVYSSVTTTSSTSSVTTTISTTSADGVTTVVHSSNESSR